MKRGKNINLFLMDGNINGRMKCTLANWTGVVYKIPRTDINKCKEIKDLNQSGIYFLFGRADETNESIVYIGQAGARKTGDGILKRLQEHKDNDKYYWTEAVIFTTSNNSFGQTEINYLENKLYNLALIANRYIIKNNNNPTKGNVTEEKESELEEFIDNAKILIGTLGYKLLEPLANNSTDLNDNSNDELLYIKYNNLKATAKRTNEGFVVFKGSEISPTFTNSCQNYIKNLRQKYTDKIDNYILKEDILFTSPSTAGSFVAGNSSNGNICWCNKNGVLLKDLDKS